MGAKVRKVERADGAGPPNSRPIRDNADLCVIFCSDKRNEKLCRWIITVFKVSETDASGMLNPDYHRSGRHCSG